MKTYSVYKLIENNKCIYIGCSQHPTKRLSQHKSKKYKGRDIEMQIVKEFDDVETAYYYEGYLKYKYGFRDKIYKDRWTHSKSVNGGIIAGNKTKKLKTGIHGMSRQKLLESCSKAGKIGGNISKHNGHLERMTQKSIEVCSKPVLAYTKSGQFVGEYYGLKEAARQLSKLLGCKVHQSAISGVISGNLKTHCGLIFKLK